MTITILHTGQTGVERGADRAARESGLAVGGVCSFERRDELGALPPAVLASLQPCASRGARAAQYATLELASFLLIAVPAASQANANTGIEALRRFARKRGVEHRLVDPATDLELAMTAIAAAHRKSDLRIMVTGPRFTRWHEGERIGWRAVAQLALAAEPPKRRVLVVDDHRDTAETVCRLLRVLGNEVVYATTGTAALELAASFRPDVGLFDIGLPDISGFELARRVRADRDRSVFLAAITGWDEARDAERAFAAGFDRHVLKPAGADVICKLIEQASQQLAG